MGVAATLPELSEWTLRSIANRKSSHTSLSSKFFHSCFELLTLE